MTYPTRHIPYKFNHYRPVNIKGALARHVGREQFVTPDVLEQVLNDVFEALGEEHRQDWLEIERWEFPTAAAAASLFDAVIDPAATADDAANHIYPNLEDLIAGESWDETYTFNVAMRSRPGTPVVDTASITVPGPIAIYGLGPSDHSVTVDGQMPDWDIRDEIDVTSNEKGAALYNIHIFKSTSGSNIPFLGDIYSNGCFWQGFQTSLAATTMGSPCQGAIYAHNSVFSQQTFFGIASLYGCQLKILASVTLTSSTFSFVGGTMDFSGSPTITVNVGSSEHFAVQGVKDPGTFSDSGSGGCTWAFTGTGQYYLDLWSGANGNDTVTVAAGCHDTYVRGGLASLTVSGNTNNRIRRFDCGIDTTADITGPANVDIHSGATTAKVVLRGPGVLANIQLSCASNVALELINCDDPLIMASLNNTNVAAGKPYAIDAASLLGILIVTGSNTGWPNPGTNAGTVVVRDETTI